MKAVRYADYGDPSVLKLEELQVPSPGEGEVLVRVRATGVHPMDWKTRAGYLKQYMPLELPHTPGWELAGTVEALGPGVESLAVGDRVFGRASATYAEYTVAPQATIAKLPDWVSFEAGAALGLTGVSAWLAVEAADVHPGQRVLIQGGAGGVGSIALQLAKRAGAHVIATASAKNVDHVRALGADEAVDYSAAPFESHIEPVDAVIDTVGGDTLDRSWALVKRGGILVTFAGQPDAAKAEELGIRIGTSRQAEVTTPILSELAELVASGQIKVAVDSTFPLEQAAAAHAASETGHGRGRRVLLIS